MNTNRERRTYHWSKDLRIAINIGGNARKPWVELVAGLYQSLAGRDLGSQSHAFRAFGIIVYGIRSTTHIIRHRPHLFIRICKTISQHNRSKVDMFDSRVRGKSQIFICLVNHAGEIRSIYPAITLCSDMEWLRRIFRESVQKQLQERVDVFTGCRGVGNCCAIVSIGIANIDWLVEENNVEMIVPGVGVVTGVNCGTFFVDGARA